MNKIIEILLKNTTFNLEENRDKFVYSFEQLYQLPILKNILDLIITKAEKGETDFKIEVSKVWNRLAGHCQSSGIFSKIGEKIFHRHTHIITIKNINTDVVIHEIAHAIEKESGLDLNGEFRQVLAMDMNNKTPSNPMVANAVRTVMRDELKGYELKNIMSELFARYFELLGMSNECGGYGRFHFYYKDITGFFAHTTKWVEEKFNPTLTGKINPKISQYSSELISSLEPYKKKWTDNIKSTHQSSSEGKQLSNKWTSKTKSNFDWEKSYKEFEKKTLKDE